MAGLGEVMRSIQLSLGEAEPVAALLLQAIIAQAAKQDVIWSLVLGVPLEAVTLEILCEEGAFGGLLHRRRCDRVAEDRQTTVLLPVFEEAAFDTVGDAGHVETHRRALSV